MILSETYNSKSTNNASANATLETPMLSPSSTETVIAKEDAEAKLHNSLCRLLQIVYPEELEMSSSPSKNSALSWRKQCTILTSEPTSVGMHTLACVINDRLMMQSSDVIPRGTSSLFYIAATQQRTQKQLKDTQRKLDALSKTYNKSPTKSAKSQSKIEAMAEMITAMKAALNILLNYTVTVIDNPQIFLCIYKQRYSFLYCY